MESIRPGRIFGPTVRREAGAPGVPATRGRAPFPVRAGSALRPIEAALRRHRRILLWLAFLGFAAYALVPSAGQLEGAVAAVGSARPRWIFGAALVASLLYPMAAWAQLGAVETRLPFGRTALVQLAAMFVNQFAPQGLGGMGLNQRYIERQGVPRATAVGAVVLNMAAGAAVHVLALAVVLLFLGRELPITVTVRTVTAAALALVGAVVLVGIVARSSAGWRRVVAPAAAATRGMALTLRRPVRALQLFGGSAGITASYALTLVLCVRAFGGDASPLALVAAYLVGTALGSLLPTPGGVGGIEAALVAGLLGAGMPVGPALTAVSTFRLLTFWLPILPGLAAFRHLRKSGAI